MTTLLQRLNSRSARVFLLLTIIAVLMVAWMFFFKQSSIDFTSDQYKDSAQYSQFLTCMQDFQQAQQSNDSLVVMAGAVAPAGAAADENATVKKKASSAKQAAPASQPSSTKQAKASPQATADKLSTVLSAVKQVSN